MKLLLAVADGQVCHCRSSDFTVWPRPMSDFATSTSVVGSCATGSTGACLWSEPLARYAAMPPAQRAITRTMMREVFIRYTSSTPSILAQATCMIGYDKSASNSSTDGKRDRSEFRKRSKSQLVTRAWTTTEVENQTTDGNVPIGIGIVEERIAVDEEQRLDADPEPQPAGPVANC